MMPASLLRQVLDPLSTQLRVEIKGSMGLMASTLVYITSNTHPGQWYRYRNDGEELALWGRMNVIRVYTGYKTYKEFVPPPEMPPPDRAGWFRNEVVQYWNENHLGGDAPERSAPIGGHFENQ